MRIGTRNLLLFGAVASFVLLAAVFVGAWKARHDANALMAALREMASNDSMPQFEVLRNKYGRRLKQDQHCTALDCQYLLEINNRAVSWTHVFPYTELDAYFTIFHGQFEFFFISFRQELRHRNAPVVHVRFVHSNELSGGFFLNPHGRSNDLWNGMIDFNLAATPTQRDAALDVNLNCFVKMGGCHNIAEMSPRIWNVTSQTVIYSRMPSSADAIGDQYAP